MRAGKASCARPARLTALSLTALLAAACGGEADVHHHRTQAFGTQVEVSLYGMPPDQANRVVRRIDDHLQTRHRHWHPGGEGALDRVNRQLAEDGRADTPEELAPLLDHGLALAERTDYRFDPGIGALYQAWGLEAGAPDDATPPTERTLERWREAPQSAAHLDHDGDGIRTAVTDMHLDFRAVTTGAALREARQVLAEASDGPDAAMINADTGVAVVGSPGDRAWHVAVRDPDGRGVIGTARIRDGEAAVTVNSQQGRFRHEGTWYHEVLNPASGMPARSLAGVLVLDDDPLLADAAATALMVAGRDGWRELATVLELEKVLAMEPDRTVLGTPALMERLELDDKADVRINTVDVP